MTIEIMSAEPSISDRRLAPRFPRTAVAQLVMCQASRPKVRLNVSIQDYSTTGIGIVYPEPLRIGQRFIVIEPYITRGGSTVYTVVRCDPRADGSYSIGLHMCNVVRDPIEQMMDEFVPLPDRDRGWVKKIFGGWFLGRR
jgi:hypothetical protein